MTEIQLMTLQKRADLYKQSLIKELEFRKTLEQKISEMEGEIEEKSRIIKKLEKSKEISENSSSTTTSKTQNRSRSLNTEHLKERLEKSEAHRDIYQMELKRLKTESTQEISLLKTKISKQKLIIKNLNNKILKLKKSQEDFDIKINKFKEEILIKQEENSILMRKLIEAMKEKSIVLNNKSELENKLKISQDKILQSQSTIDAMGQKLLKMKQSLDSHSLELRKFPIEIHRKGKWIECELKIHKDPRRGKLFLSAINGDEVILRVLFSRVNDIATIDTKHFAIILQNPQKTINMKSENIDIVVSSLDEYLKLNIGINL